MREDAVDRLEFQVSLQSSPDRVWDALVEPDQRAAWFFPGVLDPRPGGSVALDETGPGITGRVVTVEVPSVLVLDWSSLDGPDSRVSFHLEADGTGTAVRLTHLLNSSCRPGRLAAGWHAILDDLAEFVDQGSVTSRPDRHLELMDRYRAWTDVGQADPAQDASSP